MAKQHQQPVAHIDAHPAEQATTLAAVLALATAPLGMVFPMALLRQTQSHKAFEPTPAAIGKLLTVAGFVHGILAAEQIDECQFPVLVWQGTEGPWLKTPENRWYNPAARPCPPVELKANTTAIALTEAPEDEPGSMAGIMDVIRGYKPQLLQVALLGMLVNCAGASLPLFSMAVYDRVLPVGATRTLWLLTLGIGLLLTLDILLRLLRSYALTAILSRASLQQDTPLLATLLKQRGTGTRWAEQLELMRMAHEIREQVIMHIMPVLADVPFVLLFLFAISMIAPQLLPVPLTLLLITLVVQVMLLPRLKAMAKHLTHATHQRNQLLLETFRSGTATRLANRQHEAVGRWNIFAAKIAAAEERGQFWNSFGQHITITVAQLSFVATLIVGALMVMEGNLTVGALVATSLLCSRTITPALHLIDMTTRLQSVRANLRLLKKGLSWPTEPLAATAATPETLTQCKGELVMSNVGLALHAADAQGVLKGLNVKIGGGERWAVVGGIGAGKSSLLALMSALLDPTEGEMKLDGVNYARMPVSEIRRHILLVSQTPVFADLTVREIICGMTPVNDMRMREALAVSGFDAVLARHGSGLEFRPGPNGERLSGGQRQMLALAVAIYAQPKVLLMDEPTGAFDPDAEKAFSARMKEWLKGRDMTLVLVTHRHELLELVEHMLVLVQGRAIYGGDKSKVLQQLKAAGNPAEMIKDKPHAKHAA